MEGTQILRCDCSHEYQDKKYGARMRVHNRAAGAKTLVPKWRCTVCKKEK